MKGRALVALSFLACLGASEPLQNAQDERRPFTLAETTLPGTQLTVLQGTCDVYEDRAARKGRVIGLNVVVLPATGPDPREDPIFLLAGGPGQAATSLAMLAYDSWMRHERDIVLVDQRGTGASNPLHCSLSGDLEGPQGHLEPIFQPELFRACLEELRRRADLTLYSTPIAMDDLDQVREALGYEMINLIGGSYGSRAALIYMQRHPATVRTAVLKGVAPTALKNPLYHARGAQKALDWVFATCRDDPECNAAFPDLRAEFEEIVARLDEEPAEVTVRDASGDELTLRLTRRAFAEALRVMLYSSRTARRVPLLLHRARAGDYGPFVAQGVMSNRGLRDILAFGMLLCVTCAEDVARITPAEIRAATLDTFLGDARVRSQREICSFWPQSELSKDYAEPVTCDAPTLIVSGIFDHVR